MTATLIERIGNPKITTVNPFEVARALTTYHLTHNSAEFLQLRSAYLISAAYTDAKKETEGKPAKKSREIISQVDEDLLLTAGLADIVNKCGYETSGQLHMTPKTNGPVAQYISGLIQEQKK